MVYTDIIGNAEKFVKQVYPHAICCEISVRTGIYIGRNVLRYAIYQNSEKISLASCSEKWAWDDAAFKIRNTIMNALEN